jgi:hypothetical protein
MDRAHVISKIREVMGQPLGEELGAIRKASDVRLSLEIQLQGLSEVMSGVHPSMSAFSNKALMN